MSQRLIQVGYVDRAGTPNVATVRVTHDRYAYDARRFYASHTDSSPAWGCGKNARNIAGAVRQLVQDMAIITWIGKE